MSEPKRPAVVSDAVAGEAALWSDQPVQFVSRLVSELAARELTLAVAESLTGGLVTAEFVRPPGASAVLLGGIVAYDTSLKHTLIGVDAGLLAEHGPVHPQVAMQMADRVRSKFAVSGRPADLGLATTGVAGPDPQAGVEPGTVHIGVAVGNNVDAIELHLTGTRDQIRAEVVTAAVRALAEAVLP